MIKILLAPSEGKIYPHESQNTSCLNLNHKAIEIALDEYTKFLQTASEKEIITLFGGKTLNLHELALSQNCLHAPCIEAVRLYNGVAYKALDFEKLESKAQTYLYKHCFIFSNLFGMLRADEKIPYYNLHQGKGRGAFELKTLYKKLKAYIDEVLQESEVIDLRAEAYIKAYSVEKCKHYVQVMFLKNGKRISHYAKFYRGLYARALAQGQIDMLSDLKNLKIDTLDLIDSKTIQNRTILTYEISSKA